MSQNNDIKAHTFFPKRLYDSKGILMITSYNQYRILHNTILFLIKN